jgi:hypothetical protein
MSYDTIKTQCLAIAKTITALKDTYSAATISFDATTKRISDSASGLVYVVAGDILTVSGSTSNNGKYHVTEGSQAGYFVVSEDLVTEIAGDNVTIAAPVHVKHGDYGLFDQGLLHFLVFVPGNVSESVKVSQQDYKTYGLYGDLFAKFTNEPEAWDSLITLRSSIIATFEKYPRLNNTTGITRVRVSCPDDPEAVFDKSKNGPFWLTQRLVFSITIREDVSGGDYPT